ncbi:MAG: protein-(glutamine-N5) methyltransferase, release factor-specific [Gammaproteobacteria bacterium]|nr:MAG: protein-(glutamine-N5) methyltransferase, release factor-specific [Gammaproteobacteria bacterium]
MTAQQSIGDWLDDATNRILSQTPRLDAELLLSHYLSKNRAYLLAFADELLPAELMPTLTAAVKRLANGYPLAYLLGKKSFWDMHLTVNEATLIPRPDSETLIETCKKLLPADFKGKILDLGTGSGAIAIALSRLFPKAHIMATDNNQAALSVAQQNAVDWQIAPVELVYADWFLPLDGRRRASVFPDNSFAVIVSNPPYIAENDPHLQQLSNEPITALISPDNGLADIKMLIRQSAKRLKNGGYLLLEHGYDQGQAVRAYFARYCHWQNIQTVRDLGGNERVSLAQYQTTDSQI